MSEFREDLLVTAINKKRVIKIILTAVLLVFAFAFSTVFFSFLWNTLRPPPNDQLSKAKEEEGIPTQIPFPYNISDFQDLFSDLNLTTDELTDFIDALSDMFDGDIDGLDLGDYGAALAALMFSEVEVFRISNYSYDYYNEILTKFWKYESFDEYTGDAWNSSAATAPFSNYTYDEYYANPPLEEILKIQIPLTPSAGPNSMVIPTLFHTPFIMENSLNATNIYNITTLDIDQTELYKDDFNCTILDPYFTVADPVNLTYDLFGLDLPTSSEIDAVAKEPSYTPDFIKSKYLQLKGDTIDIYISNNDDFAYHYNQINATILSSDNTFIVADKIRNYLQYNFIRISDPSQYNPAPDGYDHVEWFLEEGIGYWSDFTSAFCVFARAFGIASRFVDGFNSFLAEELIDNNGKNATIIKYKNMYNWAEIYIPTDNVTDDGIWIQMDVYYDNYGSVPPSLANYSLVLNSNFTVGYRGTTANLTASLTLDSAPVEGATISFYDLTSLQILGQSDTNLNGNASIIVNIDNLQVVGPHLIFAQYNPDVNDTTTYTVYGDIQVNLQNINPQEVNISIDTSTNIQGYVIDPVNNQRVSGVEVEFVLLQKGTNNRVGTPPFDNIYTIADLSGDFNVDINVNNVSVGQYDLRVDTNGSLYTMLGFVNASGFINGSSNRMDFNITKGIVKNIWFYINNIPSNIPNSPVVNRFTNLILKAKVVNETNYPLPNQNVQFFDFWSGIQIGTNTTDANGIATYNYFVNNLMTTGPNLLYAKLGIKENHSYFILNEEPLINILSGPSPREINRTVTGASNIFCNIEGELLDRITGRPIRNSNVTLKLLKNGIDYSTYLRLTSATWTDLFGYFNLRFRVASNTPTGNYTLRLDFNGTISRMGHPIFPAFFDLPHINTSSAFVNELMVKTPTTLTFNFWIDGAPSGDYDQPVIYRNEYVNLSVYLESGGIPISDDESIDFYDVTQNILIGSTQTINGSTSLIYFTDFFTVAGPHQVYARWGSNYNHSYFIYNAPITLNLENGPVPNIIARSGLVNRDFNLHGYVNDSNNGSPIKYARIFVYMYDEFFTDYTGYLNLTDGFLRLDESGEFDLTYKVISSTPEKNYTLVIMFDGWFMYSLPLIQQNIHNFYLGSFSNFTSADNGNFDLQVYDPEDLDILLSVEGNPSLSFYNNTNPPETYKFGDVIHLQVQLNHVELFDGRTVYLYDDYTGILLNSSIFQPASTGFVQFNIQTNQLHAGLIRFRVNYHTFSTFNTTYVVINETIDISINLNRNVVQRNFHQFNVDGILQQNGTHLDGLVIGFILWDSTLGDVSGYLNLNGPQFRTIFGGNYLYASNSINLTCPQGSYNILIFFTGNLNDFGISLVNYMDISLSTSIPITVTAGTNLIGNTWYTDYDLIWPEFDDQWIVNDTIHILGSLEWDNGTAIPFMFVNVTVKLLDGTIIAFNDTVQTDALGNFHVQFFIDQDNPLWPRYRVDSDIRVYFDPIFNGLQYVTSSEYLYS